MTHLHCLKLFSCVAIWYALQENGIPCGKSDPLNVAKNTSHLNEEWAKGKRPESAATAVVKFLSIVMDSGRAKRARLIDFFFFRLWKYAESVTEPCRVKLSLTRQGLGILIPLPLGEGWGEGI